MFNTHGRSSFCLRYFDVWYLSLAVYACCQVMRLQCCCCRGEINDKKYDSNKPICAFLNMFSLQRVSRASICMNETGNQNKNDSKFLKYYYLFIIKLYFQMEFFKSQILQILINYHFLLQYSSNKWRYSLKCVVSITNRMKSLCRKFSKTVPTIELVSAADGSESESSVVEFMIFI